MEATCRECKCTLNVTERGAKDEQPAYLFVTITAGQAAKDPGRERYRWSFPIETKKQESVRVGRECGCATQNAETKEWDHCVYAPYLEDGKPVWK